MNISVKDQSVAGFQQSVGRLGVYGNLSQWCLESALSIDRDFVERRVTVVWADDHDYVIVGSFDLFVSPRGHSSGEDIACVGRHQSDRFSFTPRSLLQESVYHRA